MVDGSSALEAFDLASPSQPRPIARYACKPIVSLSASGLSGEVVATMDGGVQQTFSLDNNSISWCGRAERPWFKSVVGVGGSIARLDANGSYLIVSQPGSQGPVELRL